jgi:hypothetical protein
VQKSHQRSLIQITHHFGNVGLGRLFLGLFDNSSLNATATVSAFSSDHSRMYLKSALDLSLLSVDALDDLLSSESILVDSEEALVQFLFRLGDPFLLRHIQWQFVSAAAITSLCEDPVLFPPMVVIWQSVVNRLTTPPILPGSENDSLIVKEFPPLCEEFQGKKFKLLWRGSRDGFGAMEFHDRCDGYANTLTLILDTKGNIFGGFTPVEWESRLPASPSDCSNCWKSDPRMKSFLFTLKNPFGTDAMKFELRPEKQKYAVWCCSSDGPWFGGNDILVCDDSNHIYTCTSNHTYDYGYLSAVYHSALLTGSEEFKVKEIEVFEVLD